MFVEKRLRVMIVTKDLSPRRKLRKAKKPNNQNMRFYVKTVRDVDKELWVILVLFTNLKFGY